ncbi:MAG TPA: hypothetical protein VLJ37_08135 [bacterium]|nr:hypothetical protein [bacterium]
MLPPAFQSHLAQLASLGQQMHRLALGPDLDAAVTAAREALSLLRDESILSARPEIPLSVRKIEQRLREENADNLRTALRELTQLIQSLGPSSKPFLVLIQNAPDQKGGRVRQAALAPAGDLRKTSLESALALHWDRGEHGKARDLLDRIIQSARNGDTACLTELGSLAVSGHRTISVNIPLLADLLEASGWHEYTLKLIDSKRPLLIPGLKGTPVNPNLLMRLLDQPPPVPESVNALVSVLKKRADKDAWGLRGHAARGLFSLTTPLRGEVLPVFDYWKAMINAWPVRLPKINPSRFGPARWDLFEEHLRTAFGVVENRQQPLALRREALTAVWSGYGGGPESAPKALWIVAYFRTRQILEGEPGLETPSTTEAMQDLRNSGEFSANETAPVSEGPAEEPLRLLRQLAVLAAELGVSENKARPRPPYLRVVASGSFGTAGAQEPAENLRRLTALAQRLGTYGVLLDAPFVSDLMRAAVRSLIAVPGSGLTVASEPVASFRKSLYALHPAAAVSGWLDETGSPWPSQDLPRGHQLEGVLALLRWIRDREKEPEEIKRDSARRYWDLHERLTGRRWTAVQPRPLEWWNRHLARDLPAALASQEREAREAGTPRGWAVYARNHPEVMSDLQALARSPFPGTSSLAEQILRVLSLRPAS